MNDSFWNVFCETGEPAGYLLYKAVRAAVAAEEKQTTDSIVLTADGGESASA